jgi:hypothetical protein
MEKFYVTWEEIEELVDLLAKQIAQSGIQIEYIFGYSGEDLSLLLCYPINLGSQ